MIWIIFPQHIFGHHPFTNIDGVDPDISTAKEVIICYWNYHVLCFGFIVGVLIYGTSNFIWSQNGKINSILTSSRYLFKLFEGVKVTAFDCKREASFGWSFGAFRENESSEMEFFCNSDSSHKFSLPKTLLQLLVTGLI